MADIVKQTQPNRTSTPFALFEKYEEVRKGVVRKRNLKYDFNALADFEQEMGMGFAQLMQMKAGFACARALIWAGLKHEDRTLTVEYVGERIHDLIKNGDAKLSDFLDAGMKAAAEHGALGPEALQVRDKGPVEGPPASPFDQDVNSTRPMTLDVVPTNVTDGPGTDGSDAPNRSDTVPSPSSPGNFGD